MGRMSASLIGSLPLVVLGRKSPQAFFPSRPPDAVESYCLRADRCMTLTTSPQLWRNVCENRLSNEFIFRVVGALKQVGGA